MKRLFSGFTLLLAITGLVQAQNAAPTQPAPQKPDVAAQKYGKDGKVNPGFAAAHNRFVKIAEEGAAELVFLGDSITAGWNGKKAIWEEAFGAYKPANFGIGGDRTQHVLWRIENGELDGKIKPKAVVIMIGTNNSGSDSAEGIASGVTRIVETVREKQPQAKILLLAVFPRGPKAEGNSRRDKLKAVNDTIAKLDDGKHIHYLDIGDKFLEEDGTLTKEIMPDYLHLSAAGYQIWADAISPKLAELMK
ncbi:MAG: platelet-activating factor acetylhydrolase IB subunit [Verrucomicrobiales bacterium]|nr:platelet-activating factor acetylhydrolase IB subunit [Verrucomicrobiales bacterium]